MQIESPDLEVPEDQWIFEWILRNSVQFKADPTWEEISVKTDRAMVVCVTESSCTVMATREAFDRVCAIPADDRIWILVPTEFLVRIMPQLRTILGVGSN